MKRGIILSAAAYGLSIALILVPRVGLGDSALSASRCYQHFFGRGCENLGTSFQGALAAGQAICRDRYDSPYANQLGQFADSLAALNTSSSGSSCHLGNDVPGGYALTSAGGALFQVVSVDSTLSQRIGNLESVYAALASTAGSDPICRSRLNALRSELARARVFVRQVTNPAGNPAGPVMTAELVHPVIGATTGTGVAAAIPPVSVSRQNSGAPVASSQAQTPAIPASAPMPESLTFVTPQPVSAANPQPVAPAQVFPAPFYNPAPPDPASAPAPVPAPSLFAGASPSAGVTWPPSCAIDAMVDETRREKESYGNKGFFGRLFAHVTGDAPRSDADQILSDPEAAQEAFGNLSKRRQQSYLEFCPEGTPKSLEQAREVTSEAVASAPSPAGFSSGSLSLGSGVGTPGASSAVAWPPACVLHTMVTEATVLKAADDSRGWFGSALAWLQGAPHAPSNADEIIQDPRKAFEDAGPDLKAKYLKFCQHEIPPEQWDVARASTGGQFVVPDYVKAEAFAPVPALPQASGAVGWPPQCAIDAMVDDIHDLQESDQQHGWLVRGLLHLSGQPGAPPDADAMLKDPKEAFLNLNPDDQTKYMRVCLLKGPSVFSPGASPFTVASEVAGGTPGAASGAPSESAQPPSCALNAYSNEISKEVQSYQKKGWFGRLFASAPPKDAAEIIQNPVPSFERLSQGDQVAYLRACLPCPAHPKKPGLLTRIHNWIQNLGWFGKTLAVLGSAIFGALIWRIRGGFLPTGSTTAARLIATGGMGLLGYLLGGPAGLLAGLLTFPELAMFGLEQYFDGGMTLANGAVNWSKTLGLDLRGLAQTLPNGLILTAAGYSPWFMLAGGVMGFLYLLPFKFFPNTKVLPNFGGGFIPSPAAWGEIFSGAMIFGSLAATLLAGNGSHAPIVACMAAAMH